MDSFLRENLLALFKGMLSTRLINSNSTKGLISLRKSNVKILRQALNEQNKFNMCDAAFLDYICIPSNPDQDDSTYLGE